MALILYLPTDAFSDKRNDPDLAADYLELTAFFSPDNQALSQAVTKALEEDYTTVEEELEEREAAVASAIARISQRLKFSVRHILSK